MRHVSIVGTTASGKSSLAMDLARALPDRFEIVSVDSMQVYRGMDIGTAKPTAAEQAEVPHHMIDLVDASADYALSQFQESALAIIDDIAARGKRALLVGGTGLYLQSVLDRLSLPGRYDEVRESFESRETDDLFAQLNELDPAAAAKMESTNRRRVERALEVTLGSGKPFSSFGPGVDNYPENEFHQIGIWIPRVVNNFRIANRVATMLANGWLEEVKALTESPWSKTARQSLGYKEFEAVLHGSMSLEEARTQVINNTRSFARKQRMWFRRDPRITWFGTASDTGALSPAIIALVERTK